MVAQVGGTRYVTGHGAARYLDHPAFQAAGIAVDYIDYSCTPWPQGAGGVYPLCLGAGPDRPDRPRCRQLPQTGTLPWPAFLDRAGVPA